jgi:hypothetical protein
LLTTLCYQFNQAVRVKSLVLHTANSQEGPKLIKLLINRNALGFEDVEDAEEPEAALVQELSEDTVKEGEQIVLRFVRFQSVNSLHVSETFDLTIASPKTFPESHYANSPLDLCQFQSGRWRGNSNRCNWHIRVPYRVSERIAALVEHFTQSIRSVTKDLSELKKHLDE